MRPPVSVGIVGLGPRGHRFAEALDGLLDCELSWLCTGGANVPDWADRFPRAIATRSLDELLSDERLDAIVITGRLDERPDQIDAALAMGKHVLVDGPLAMSANEAFDLASRARAFSRSLITETAPFDPGLRKLKELITTGQLGDVFHLYVTNQRFGRIDEDCDVLWSVGPQEIATVLYLLGDVPVSASAWGESYLRAGLSDVMYGLLRFATGITAHLHLSWLDPQDVHRLAVAGSQQMAVYDGSSPEQPLALFDHEVAFTGSDLHRQAVHLTPGGVTIPRFPAEDGVLVLAQTFLSAVRRGRPVEAALGHAVNVASTLEALQASVDAGGAPKGVAPPLPHLGNVVAFQGGLRPVRRSR
jgi:predicted dehydrogenase